MRKAETITLGGREFSLNPPTLGQLRQIVDALDDMAGAAGGMMIEKGAALVVAGLERSHPALTVDAVLDFEATIAELNTAVAAVLRVSGLRVETDAPGEAAPAGERQAA